MMPKKYKLLWCFKLTMYKKIFCLILNKEFMRYFKNSLWMFLEQVILILSGIFVGVYVARYLGPEQFGVLSYALALVSIVTVFSRLGLESILVKKLTQYSEQRQYYMGTAFLLMLVSGATGAFLIGGMVYLFEDNHEYKIFVWIIATGIIFQAFLVIDYNFQAQVKAKYSSIAKSVALAVSSIVKIMLVLNNADLVCFSIAYVFDYASIAFFLFYMHVYTRQTKFFFSFKVDLIIPLLKSAWPMILSGVATIALVKIDQIMIKNMLDAGELGLYASASKIYDGIITFSFVLSVSILPLLVRLKETSERLYQLRLKQFFLYVFWLGILLSTLTTFFSRDLIVLLFGEMYSEAYASLAILMWGISFASIGFITTRYLIVEGMQKKVAKRNWIAVVINAPLNYIFIGYFGIEGAAIVTVFSLFVAHYVFDWFDKELKILRRIKNSAILMMKFDERGVNES